MQLNARDGCARQGVSLRTFGEGEYASVQWRLLEVRAPALFQGVVDGAVSHVQPLTERAKGQLGAARRVYVAPMRQKRAVGRYRDPPGGAADSPLKGSVAAGVLTGVEV